MNPNAPDAGNMAGSGVGAGISAVASSILQPAVSVYNNNKTIAANKELAEYQHAKNLEMWHQQNAYNAPQMQMARLKAAGLNPHLVYGTGAVANSTSQIPQYQAPRVDYNYKAPDLATALQIYNNLQLQNAQIDNIKAQTEKTQADTVNTKLTSGILGSESEIKSAAATVAPLLNKLEVINKQNLNDSVKKDIQIKETTHAIMQLELQWNQEGMTKNDNIGLRMLFKSLRSFGIEPNEVLNKLGEPLRQKIAPIIGKEE